MEKPGEAGEVAEAMPVYDARPDDRAQAEIRALVDRLLAADAAHRGRAEELISAMLPSREVPSPTAVLQARRNAAARDALLQEFGALDSGEVAAAAGSAARNRAALAHRWKQEGRIFSVPHRGAALFPGFQLDDGGRPRAVIAQVIAALGGAGSEWELALWFTAPSGRLGGRRPVDLLASDPRSVAETAEREAAGLVF